MSRADAFSGSRRVPQLAALALISIGVAGCSSDMSSRLANPFGYQGEATGSVPAPVPQAQVERRDLPQYSRPAYQSSSQPPVVSAPQSYPAQSYAAQPSYPSASAGVSGGGRGLASYTPPPSTPPARPHLQTTASVLHTGAHPDDEEERRSG